MSADGGATAGDCNTGGAGGSVWIDTDVLAGSSTMVIRAIGQKGNNKSTGAGGGGRGAVYYSSTELDIGSYVKTKKINALGFTTSSGESNGTRISGAGTVYIEHKGTHSPRSGNLYVSNNSQNGKTAGLVEDAYVFNKITTVQQGHLAIVGQNSALRFTSSSSLVGDSSMPDIVVEGTINYLGQGSLDINGVDLNVKGALSGVSDFSIGNTLAGGMTLYANTWYYNNSNQHDFDNVTVGPNGVMTLIGYDNGDTNYTNDYAFTLNADSLDIQEGGSITSDGKGYGIEKGPGYGGTDKGSSYGGYGWNNSDKPVAMTPYGSVYEPSDLGSGSRIQPGGGAIKFVISGTLNVDGTISSNGPTGCCNHTEGPSGGSIWIDAGTFDGAGVITANGGDEHHDGGDPGSGGRIALYYTNNSSSILSTLGTDSPKIRAYGGFAGGTNRRAGAGTVYVEHKGVDTNRAGALYVDNSNGDGTNGVNSKNAGLISASYEFKSITLTRSGHLDVVGAGSSLSVSSGSAFTGDATSPDLNLFGTFAYTGEGTLGINGVNIGVRGEISGVNSFTIGSTTAAGVSLYANTWAHNKDNQYTFENITVGPVGTLSLNSYNNGDADYTNDYGASLSVTNLDIDNGGVITSQGTGYLGGPGSGDNGDNEFGGSYGGYGGRNSAFKIPYGNVFQPTDLGSSGGIRQAGGYKGGGAIKLIVSSTLTNDGTITSDGEAYTRGGWDGGSTGGSIWIDANKINGSGVIKSNGQRGDSAGGAGGRIAVYYKDETSNFPFTNTANMQAYGGIGNTQNGGPGTVYVEKLSGSTPEYNGNLFIDNNNQNTLSAALVEGEYVFESIRLTKYGHLTVLGNASKLTINSGAGMSGDATFPDINIEGTLNYTGGSEAFAINGVDLVVKGDLTGITNVDIGDSIAAGMTLYANTWAHDKNNQYSLGNVTVSSNGTLTLYPYNNADSDYTNDYGVTLTVESMTVEAGGVVTAKGLGYLNGPGSGDNGDTERGGSYGGYGGNNTSFTYPYGNVYEPIDLGSSGGIRQAGGYKGGGAIKLVVNTVLTLNGTITSDGESYTRGGWDGGAAGGSIWIDANRINGNGAIKSNGERGDGAGGSGGRIAIYYQDSDSSFPFTNTSNVQAYGGSGTVQYGGPGTIYIEHKGTDTSKSGLLLVDGNNVNTNSAALISDTYSFKTIKLTRYGHLKMTGQDAVLNVTSGAGFEGDNTFPDLTVEGTINYTGSEALEINGVDLGVAGEITGVTNFSLGTKAKAGMTLYANTWAHNKDDQYSFGDVTVGASGTLTLVSYDNQDSDYSNDYGVTVNLTNLTVLAGGRISADGQGYLNGRGPGAGNGGYCWATGPSHGGYGMTASGAAGTTYGSITEPISLGSASGTQYGGTGGGGSLKLVISGTLTIEGTISADGGNTSGDCNTGGAGGSIWINTATIDGDAGAIISADGAKGNINNQGVGGGGRVAIYYSTDELNIENMITSGGIRAYGGYDGTRSGGPGTVYIENKTAGYNGAGDLYIKNNYSTTAYSGSFNGNYAFHDVTIGNGVRVKVEGNKDTNTGTVLQVSGDFTLGTGALIDGVGQGFGSGEGPGKGASGVGQSGGGGGAHGGSGGAGQSDGSDASNIGGSSYGNQRIPVTLGSGGGPSGAGAAGGAGGGAFALRARDGHVQIDGDINVSGTNGKVSSPGGGGGAGGSILVEAATCEINGDLYANGGDGGNNSYDGGGAGGGRISILYTTGPCNVLGTVVSAQGTSESGQAGQAGIFPGTLVLPSVPSVREQYKSDETTNIPVGEVTQEKEVILKASIFDPGASDANPRNLVAEFEVAPKDENFSGGVLGTSVVTSNPISFKGGDPTLASATVTGLTPGEGYKWQVRVKNVDDGVSSEWVEFGANPADDADFVVGTVEELRIEVDKNEVNVGDKITITVKAYDAEGEIDPSYEGTVTFGSTSDTAVLPANYIFSSADDQGEHVFSEELIFTEGGTFTVTVTDAISEELTATTGEITVIAPEPESPTDPGDVEEKTCEEDVNQAECQLDVEITDITVSIDKDSAKICYKTNIETRGFIEYGKIVNKKATYSSTTSMDEYAKDHCFELTKLSEKQAYAYKINAVSYAGKTAETQATFATKGGKAPVQDDIVVEEPIKNVNYSFDSDNNAVLRFEVIKNSRCYVDYGHILSDLENRALSNSQGTSHKAYLELDKLNGTSDLIYVITCSTIEDDDKKIQTYTKNGVITHAKYKKYYPQPKQEKQTVTSFIESISQTEVPVVLTAAAATTSILSLLLYPRFVLYAVGWLTGRRRVRNWGLIFDTATNEAVAFAVVKLYDKTGKLIQENVTDIHGQYGFTVDKGEFNLIAEHPEYNQQEVSVTSKDEGMITKDVGLTPKVVKTKGAKVKKQLKVNWRKLNAVLFVIGFMFSLIALVLYPVTYNLVIFLLYSLQIIILYLLRTPRGWGYVYDSLNSRRLQGAFVRLWDPQQGTQLKVQLTDSKGRYGFINGRGNYELTVDKAGYRFPSAKDSVNNMSVTRTGQKMIKVSTTEFKPINQTIPVDPDSEGVSGPFGN